MPLPSQRLPRSTPSLLLPAHPTPSPETTLQWIPAWCPLSHSMEPWASLTPLTWKLPEVSLCPIALYVPSPESHRLKEPAVLSCPLCLSPSLFPATLHTCFLSQGEWSGPRGARWADLFIAVSVVELRHSYRVATLPSPLLTLKSLVYHLE